MQIMALKALLIFVVAAILISSGVNCTNCLWFKEAACAECKQGFYGEDCEHKCVRCSNGCKKSDGNCHGCKHGYYGNNCSTSCPANCHGSLDDENVRCSRYTGVCNHGCKDSWWGDLCDSRCSEDCGRGKCFQEDGTCEKRVRSSTSHASATNSKNLTAEYGPDAYQNVSTAVKPTLKVWSGVLAIVFMTVCSRLY